MTGDPVLERDSDLRLPGVTVLKASAGSGKTHSLTKRLVQLLLSDRIPNNDLCQVLALTFSNNAAREMRERVLQWLKDLHFGDERALSEIGALVSLERDALAEKAGRLIEKILDAYTDFQVRTIDSFMTSVFKASAIDLGYAPEFEIMMEGRPLTEYAFDILLRDVRAGSEKADLVGGVIDDVQGGRGSGGSFIWDPASILLQELDGIDAKLASRGRPLSGVSLDGDKTALETRIRDVFRDLQSAVEEGLESGLELNSRSVYGRLASIISVQQEEPPGSGSLADLSGVGMALLPVKKSGKHAKGREHYEEIERIWDDLRGLVSQYTSVLARSHYAPFLQLYRPFAENLVSVKRRFSRVFIEDINRVLSGYLDASLVPDVYLRLGDRVYHHLIDEFQDTSPVQWRNLSPLIDESLSKGGSLFVVGDTKQAIYAFRDTDYRIMRRLETEKVFASAERAVKELDTNYRSTRKILDLTDRLFREILVEPTGIPETPDERMDMYRAAASESGLTDYVQKPRPGAPEGHAEIALFAASADNPPEREKILAVIDDLRARGYGYGDVAVLAPRNEEVVRITGWLSDRGIPFLSFSSLDVRRRKLTGEIFSLLRFLHSPVDDVSFASFILGDIFAKAAAAASGSTDNPTMRDFVFTHRTERPLYKAFQRKFPVMWEAHFSRLFKTAGYLPLYDLLCGVYADFDLFASFSAEEATLAKILDAVRTFEGLGQNSLSRFLDMAEAEDEGPWVMDVPPEQDAVKVMTIHKSKGLGFPAVITVFYEKPVRIDNRVLEEDENGEVRLVKVTENNSRVADDLSKIYRAQLLREYVNSLNALYVGVTRAKEEFYLIGLRKDDAKPAGFPVDILEKAGFPPAPVAYARPAREEAAHTPDAVTTHIGHPPRLPAAPGGELGIRERLRGVFIHRVLRDILWRGDLARLPLIIAQAQRELGCDASVSDVSAVITRLLDDPAIGSYFNELPGRRVMIEKEFADRRGALYRMDRVVVDTGAVAVIDFKTGGGTAGADHAAQVGYYMTILRPLFPGRDVKGFIAYVDGPALREVP